MANTVLYMGGILNFTDPIFHFQAYIWLWMILSFISVVCYAAWYYGRWKPFKALHGLYYAFKAESNAAFIYNLELISELVSESEAKCIFDYSKFKYEGLNRIQAIFFNYASVYLPELSFGKALLYKYGKRNMDVDIAKKLQNHEWETHSSVTIGTTHTDMILDSDRWSVRDSPQHALVEKDADKWNEVHPDDQIHSYSKYQRYIIEDKLVPSPGITPFVTIPWVRIDSAFPLDMEDNELSGARRQKAEEEVNAEKNALTKFYLPVLGGCFGLAILILAARVFTILK